VCMCLCSYRGWECWWEEVFASALCILFVCLLSLSLALILFVLSHALSLLIFRFSLSHILQWRTAAKCNTAGAKEGNSLAVRVEGRCWAAGVGQNAQRMEWKGKEEVVLQFFQAICLYKHVTFYVLVDAGRSHWTLYAYLILFYRTHLHRS